MKNLPASIHTRLLNQARARGIELQRLLTQYAYERLLYRIGCSDYREAFVLKGAMLFVVWEQVPSRRTRDADFSAAGASVDEVVSWFRAVLKQRPIDDGVTFSDDLKLEPLLIEEEPTGVQIRFRAEIGTMRVDMQADIAVSATASGRETTVPTLLDFPPPRILAYPPERSIAEKVHAMAFHGEANSRFKDFFDIYVLSNIFDFDAGDLRGELTRTFDGRASLLDPAMVALTPAFYEDERRQGQWTAFLRRATSDVVPGDLRLLGEGIRAFILPVVRSDGTTTWTRGGPWT